MKGSEASKGLQRLAHKGRPGEPGLCSPEEKRPWGPSQQESGGEETEVPGGRKRGSRHKLEHGNSV